MDKIFKCVWMGFLCAALAATAAAGEVKRLALYTNGAVSTSSGTLYALLVKNPAFQVTRIKAAEIREGKLDGFDAVLFPGGSGSKQAADLTTAGLVRVREFVRAGGGYVGFCAGSYLATCDYTWSLGLLNARVLDRKHWARGFGDVRLKLKDGAREILGRKGTTMTISYRQGPLLAPADNKDLPPYRELASYATEVAKNGAPKGVMAGTTAIATGEYGKGRVLCFSPHPELTPGLEDVVYRGVAWAAGKSAQNSARTQ